MFDQSSWRAVQEKKRAHTSLMVTSSKRLAEFEAKAKIRMVVSLMMVDGTLDDDDDDGGGGVPDAEGEAEEGD